jgi:hypothetical protein
MRPITSENASLEKIKYMYKGNCSANLKEHKAAYFITDFITAKEL